EDFIGKRGIIERGEPKNIRVGLKITGRGIARENCPVYFGDKLIGRTTSGTHSPFLGYPIAMAIIDNEYAETGTELSVDVRGKKISAEIVPLPFYKRK
ncbi:MAG TPA: glycine cleavage T C-terminal barrel domain-containing protein, partial [Mobilitalea sp.]|nr:glycine cleavage T C-terminal barrel domain-containing protein [Mobilitalea sp.]